MNIVNKVTLRQMKENKRRTIVTILGVIISVAMLTAVTTIGISFLDLMKREVIATNGEWHVQYQSINQEQLQKIENDQQVERTFRTKNMGFAQLEQTPNQYKPYVYVQSFSEEAFKQMPLKLVEGRFPEKENEIVISHELLKQENSPYAKGEELALAIGKRKLADPDYADVDMIDSSFSLEMNDSGEVTEKLVETKEKKFTIVGIIEQPAWELRWGPSYTALSYIGNQLTEHETIDLFVVLKKLNNSIFTDAETFAKKEQIEQFKINHDLLRYEGVMANGDLQKTLFSFVAIIMLIILVGSVSLIYNAFAISVAERSRYLGMLSSVGATKRQKRNSVFFEGTIIGLISIPIGIIAGIVGIGITFYFINGYLQGFLSTTEKLQVAVSIGSLLVTVLVSILTIFISTYIPARRASKVTAIDAIRQSADIKLSNKAVKTSRLVRKLFGMEAEIGLKNLKRNKRRYQATVFSIVVSIVLFLSVAYFIQDLRQSIGMSSNIYTHDLALTLPEKNQAEIMKKIEAMDEITDMNVTQQEMFTTEVPMDQLPEQLKEFVTDGESSYMYSVTAHVMKDEYLEQYAEKNGVNFEKMKTENQVIIAEKVQYADDELGKYVEMKAIHANIGDTLPLEYYQYDEEEGKYVAIDDVKIAAYTNDLPLGVGPTYPGSLEMIISESAFARLDEKMPEEVHRRWELYMTSSDPDLSQQLIDDLPELTSSNRVFNIHAINKSDEQVVIVLSIFSYGFIALITLISIANILNTISTSIALRKREFAMLKSMGMTPKGFNKMIRYESLFYGMKALLYGIPLSLLAMFGMYKVLASSFSYNFNLPWGALVIAIASVFIIVSIAMIYSSSKVKKENIIDALKQENI